MNIQKMLKQAQQMQEKLAQTQAGLADRTVESTAGGGKIKVVANGSGDVLSIKIDPSVVDPNDVEMLEDLVLVGVKQAIEDARNMAAEEMKKVTGGLNIPGL
jgi:DNA-binding YbaB/EbfC family protein